MFCRNCGKELPNGIKFCTNCGTAVQNQPEMTFESDVLVQPKKGKGGLIALTVGAVGVAAVAVGALVFINVQKQRPLAAAFIAGQNLSEDVLDVRNASFSVSAGSETVSGSASIDYDAEVLQAYFSMDGIVYALSYENGAGWMYMATDWGSGSYELEEDMITSIRESFRSAKDVQENQDLKDTDLRQILEDAGVLDEIDEYIIPDSLNSTAEKLEKRMKSLGTLKDIEEALKIEKENHTYTLPLRGDNIADTLDVFDNIILDECKELFRDGYLDEFIDACNDAEEELRTGNYDFGEVDWTIEGSRFQNISGNLHEDGDSVNTSVDFSYDGNTLSGISGSFAADGESIRFSVTDINQTENVIPDDVLSQMH